jgi:hypothetical protein
MITAFLRWILSSVLGGNAVTERALRAVEGPILFEDFFDAIDALLVPKFPQVRKLARTDLGASFTMVAIEKNSVSSVLRGKPAAVHFQSVVVFGLYENARSIMRGDLWLMFTNGIRQRTKIG